MVNCDQCGKELAITHVFRNRPVCGDCYQGLAEIEAEELQEQENGYNQSRGL